ncbi:2-phosphosulfolactate phosphatase [Candidatus Tisiphia endosymbiont of Mystacides longicornis]|uniref:2-phosphosulfolactate phosphatase n=1 Tax=Candidatus Tisiphia endosymbiont of Mystacides longicornis TaxID=3139330 RepID=UPI003CCADEE6
MLIFLMRKYYHLIIILFILSSCTEIKKTVPLSDSSGQKIYIMRPIQLRFDEQIKTQVIVVIDVFRAFTTAAYVLDHNPVTYILASDSAVVSRLISNFNNPVLIGKSEKGANLIYDVPNSPTRVQDITIVGKNVLHRTAAGASGILLAKEANIVLAAGFINASATAEYIKTLPNTEIIIIPMGHEGNTPSLEDNICAEYIKALIHGKKLELIKFLPILQEGSGKYFFSQDQWQYPKEDFFRCLEVDRFNFIIKATIMNDYAILTRGH